jgi:hypothetical protein
LSEVSLYYNHCELKSFVTRVGHKDEYKYIKIILLLFYLNIVSFIISFQNKKSPKGKKIVLNYSNHYERL